MSGVSDLKRERDRLTERVAELVSDGNQLRALHDEAHVALSNMLGQRDQLEREGRAARAELGQLRQRLTVLAADLCESAGATSPSKKSEIERKVADQLRDLLAADVPAIAPAEISETGT